MFEDGSTSRDYTYIDDIVDRIVKSCQFCLLNKNVYEILNLGNYNPISLINTIKIIGETLEIEPNIEQLPMQEGDVEITFADNITKAKKINRIRTKDTI